MGPIELARTWWQRQTGEEETPLDGDTPAWVLSLAVHVAVLLSMAGSVVAVPRKPEIPAITIIQPAAVEEQEVLQPQELTVAEEPEDSAGAKSAESVAAAAAVAPLLAQESAVPVEPVDSVIGDIRVEVPVDVVPTGLMIDENLAIRGDVAVGTEGASGAVDRLTVEIAASLEQRPTIVCWVFDQSVSLAGQRRDIAGRLQQVFDELHATGSEKHRPELLNLVFAYGKQVTPVVSTPTRDVSEVVKAIESIPIDQSGVEMTFTAVHDAAQQAKRMRISQMKRNVMIVVFTDEVGNDQDRADEVSAFCRMNAMPVYVVGVPAPFGMEKVQMRFVEFDPKYDGDEQWAVVDQGPETLFPEMVRLRSGSGADEPMDSGFGPFSLSKLCAETRGIYFCVHANRTTSGRVSDKATAPMASRLRYFFDHDVMRAYKPDYESAAKIQQMLAGNRAKKALVDAAKSSGISPMEQSEMTFPKEDEAQLAQAFSEAQKKAAVLQPKIDALYATLAAGVGDRAKIEEKRWQAGYDLAMGRVLAVKIRTDAYNQILAQAKSGMQFKQPRSDTWKLVPSNNTSNVGSQTEKLAGQARMYLERVVAEHPGTPWALLAAEELKTPLGYEWHEAHTGVAERKMAAANNNNNPPPKPAAPPKGLAPPKPKRPLANL